MSNRQSERPLQGKKAIVTGSYTNLGAVTAEVLAELGADVVINDLNRSGLAEHGESLVRRLEVHGVKSAAIPADLSKGPEIVRLCKEALDIFGRIDILINNAGPFNMDPFLQLEESVWDTVMDVNLKAVYLMSRELAPQMKANGWGRIVNMCAGSAYVRNHGVYSLAKAGVKMITEQLALELGPEVTVNAVAPGQILESLPEIQEYDPTFGDRYRARAPLDRLVTRQEIATVICQFCLPPFDSTTGATLRVDGGAEIHRF
jgi:NAD(P)-dependent dehydrogenase (short-subunit alcohol dehydrogenase family)